GSNDLRLVYNMPRLLSAPQFRSYWVQRNTADLRGFSSGVADLERAQGEFRERRGLLRASAATQVDEAAAGQLLALVPDDAGLYRAWAKPSADRVVRWMEEKLFASAAGPGVTVKTAPGVSTSADAGSEQDLETRIDEAPLNDDREARAFAAVAA